LIDFKSIFKANTKREKRSFDDIKILIIHIDKNFIENIKLFLEKDVQEVYYATDGIQGLELYNKHKPNLIICQADIPSLNGIELSKILKKISTDISIILLSNSDDSKMLYEAVEIKIDKVIIKSNEYIDEILEVIDEVLHDLKNKILSKTIECKEFFDPLTNIYNRKKMNETIMEKINVYRRFQTIFTIVLLNIEELKTINSKYGHKTGDNILKEMSKFILKNIRSIDIVGKWDSSKFIIILPQTDLLNSTKLIKKLQVKLSQNRFDKLENINVSFTAIQPTKDDDIFTITKKLEDRADSL